MCKWAMIGNNVGACYMKPWYFKGHLLLWYTSSHVGAMLTRCILELIPNFCHRDCYQPNPKPMTSVRVQSYTVYAPTDAYSKIKV